MNINDKQYEKAVNCKLDITLIKTPRYVDPETFTKFRFDDLIKDQTKSNFTGWSTQFEYQDFMNNKLSKQSRQ